MNASLTMTRFEGTVTLLAVKRSRVRESVPFYMDASYKAAVDMMP